MMRALAERLRDDDARVRATACRDAGRDPAAALLVEVLIERLDDPAGSAARAASDALVAIAARVPDLAQRLRAVLRGRAARARWGAAFTLSRLAPADASLLPAVVEAMASPDGDVRWAATRLLVDMGQLHSQVLEVAVGLAEAADDAGVRRMAIFALRELAPDEPLVARALLRASRDPDAALRRAALTAMAALYDPPREVVDRLLEALAGGDGDPALASLAAVSLGELVVRHPELATARLRSALDAAARDACNEALARVASRALSRWPEGRAEGPEGVPAKETTT